MPEEVRADLLLGRDTLSPGLVKAGKAASDASSNVRQLTRDLYEAGKTRATPIVDLNDDEATAKLESVSAKLKELGAAIADPKVDLEDKDAAAKVADMRVKLDALGRKVASPRVTLDGLARAEAGILSLDASLDRLSRKHATPDVTVSTSRGILSRLGGLFGGGGGGAGGAASAGGSLAGGTFTGPAIGIGAALASALFPALVPLGLGGLTAGGGGLLAATLGVKGTAALKTDAQAVARARASIAGAGKTTPSQRLSLQRALAQQSRDQAKFGAFAPFGNVITQLGNIAQGVLGGALTGTGRGFSGGGPGGTQNASFLTGLTDILKQLGGFVKSIGPQLGDLFRSSLPFAQAFVKVLEQFTKAVLPSMTQSLKELAPDLPILVQGFKYLSEGIAGFIQNLGPGIRDSAVIFKASMLVVKGFLQLAGLAAADFAKGIVNTGRTVRNIARGIPPFFNQMRHDIASIFDGVRHDIAHYWDVIYNDTIGVVIRLDRAIITRFDELPGQIAHALLGLGSKLYSLGRTWLTDLWHGIQSVWHTVISFFSNIPGDILHALGIHSPPDWAIDAGKHIMEGLHIGLAGTFGKLASFISGVAGKIGGALGSGVAGSAEGIAAAMLPAFGFSPAQMAPLVQLWNRESGWRWNALNQSSGAYGIPQALPADKMAAAGPDWRTNPATQIRWGLSYIKGRYGTPAAAWAHELQYGWYDRGGWLKPGLTLAYNATGRPEMVVPGGSGAGTTVVNVNVQVGHGTHPVQAAQEIAKVLNAGARNGVKLRGSIIGPG